MNLTACRLRDLRVADYLGISRTAYNNYESGAIRPTRKLERLAALFGVSADYILGRAEDLPADRVADPYIGEQWKKYLLLSDAGREMVDVMLDAVYARERDRETPRE